MRPSVSAASRSASVSAGRASTTTTSSSSSSARRSISRLSVWNSPLVVTRRGRRRRSSAERNRSTSPKVFWSSASSASGASSQSRNPSRTRSAVSSGAVPFLVCVERRVVPGLEHALAADVRPGLVRVSGQEQTLGDAERRVVMRELLGPGSKLGANRPEIREERLADRRPEVGGAGRASGPRTRADRPLDHLHVVVAPPTSPSSKSTIRSATCAGPLSSRGRPRAAPPGRRPTLPPAASRPARGSPRGRRNPARPDSEGTSRRRTAAPSPP